MQIQGSVHAQQTHHAFQDFFALLIEENEENMCANLLGFSGVT